MNEITLVPTDSSHIPAFFEFEADEEAVHMAAFATLATDPDAFLTTWLRRIEKPVAQTLTIFKNNQVVGGILNYEMEGKRHIGYWIGKSHWGQGIATEALRQLLQIETTRPIHATCVADNLGSRRVLEKNGFRYTHSEHHFATGRNQEVEEAFFKLD